MDGMVGVKLQCYGKDTAVMQYYADKDCKQEIPAEALGPEAAEFSVKKVGACMKPSADSDIYEMVMNSQGREMGLKLPALGISDPKTEKEFQKFENETIKKEEEKRN